MDRTSKEQIQDASLSRDQLTPVAREPKPDASAEGWGSFDRFPIEDREDEPVLGDTRLKPDPTTPGGAEPYHPQITDTGTWPSDAARDFRRDDSPSSEVDDSDSVTAERI